MGRIQSGAFSVERALAAVADPRAGAVVSFIGTVRKERRLGALDYEAYDRMADMELEQLQKKATAKFGLIKVVIIHRKGRLKVGEKVVIVACSAPHRREAFKACEWMVSELKKVAPIWKKEV